MRAALPMFYAGQYETVRGRDLHCTVARTYETSSQTSSRGMSTAVPRTVEPTSHMKSDSPPRATGLAKKIGLAITRSSSRWLQYWSRARTASLLA